MTEPESKALRGAAQSVLRFLDALAGWPSNDWQGLKYTANRHARELQAALDPPAPGTAGLSPGARFEAVARQQWIIEHLDHGGTLTVQPRGASSDDGGTTGHGVFRTWLVPPAPVRAGDAELRVLKHGIGYDLVVNRETGRLVLGIRCHTCRRVSYHPSDVDERYCGACHRHFEANPPPGE